MSRDEYGRWDDEQARDSDQYGVPGGRRPAPRSARPEQPWVPEPRGPEEEPGTGLDFYRGQYRDDGYPSQGAYGEPAGYGPADYGSNGGYGSNGDYGPGGHRQRGYDQNGYSRGDYGVEGSYDGGYGPPGYEAQDRYGRADQYGRSDSGGQTDPYARTVPPGQPDPYAPDQEYGRGGYGNSGNYAAPDTFGSQDHYGEQAGDRYDGRDPYGRDGSYGAQPGYGGQPVYGGQPDYGQPGFDDRGGYDEHEYGAAPGSGPVPPYEPDGYGRGPGGDARFGWQPPVDDTGVVRRGREPEDEMDADDARHNNFFNGFGGGGDDNPGRRRRRRQRPPKRGRGIGAGMIALIIFLVVIVGIAGVGYHYYSAYRAKHASYPPGPGYGSVLVTVPPGATGDELSPQLLRLGVIEAIDPWVAYVGTKSPSLQPGVFKLRKHMGLAEAWATLNDPKARVQSGVAVPDGYRATKIIALLAEKTHKPLSQFQAALKDTAALGLPSWAHGNPEGFLWPATYNFAPGSTPLDMLKTMVSQFKTEIASLNLAAKAKKANFSEYHVIIAASLLEGEVGPKYFAKVARVIDVRLNAGMTLGMDSTVAYIFNTHTVNLTQSELNSNSPYNTRNHIGLPPGPINSPDLAAIEAVLHPASGSYTYFVTVNSKTGFTKFTNSYAQFQIWSAQAKSAEG